MHKPLGATEVDTKHAYCMTVKGYGKRFCLYQWSQKHAEYQHGVWNEANVTAYSESYSHYVSMEEIQGHSPSQLIYQLNETVLIRNRISLQDKIGLSSITY